MFCQISCALNQLWITSLSDFTDHQLPTAALNKISAFFHKMSSPSVAILRGKQWGKLTLFIGISANIYWVLAIYQALQVILTFLEGILLWKKILVYRIWAETDGISGTEFFNFLPEVKLCARRHLGQGFKYVISLPTILTDSDKDKMLHPQLTGVGVTQGTELWPGHCALWPWMIGSGEGIRVKGSCVQAACGLG